MASGRIKTFVMTADELDDHARRYSQSFKGGKDSPWTTAWKAMAGKTVLKLPIQRGLIPISMPSDTEHVLTDGPSRTTTIDVAGFTAQSPAPPEPEAELPPPEDPPATFDLEQLDFDLATCQSEADVEDIRKAYLKGLAAPEASVVKQACMKRVTQLTQPQAATEGQDGQLFETTPNAAEQ